MKSEAAKKLEDSNAKQWSASFSNQVDSYKTEAKKEIDREMQERSGAAGAAMSDAVGRPRKSSEKKSEKKKKKKKASSSASLSSGHTDVPRPQLSCVFIL